MNLHEAGPSHSDEKAPINQDQLYFGPLSRDAYPAYAHAQLDAKYKMQPENQKDIVERVKLWENYKTVIRIAENPALTSVDSVMQEIILFFRKISTFADRVYGNNESGEIKELPLHLEQITKASKQLLFSNDGTIRFDELLSPRQATLMTDIIAPWHDLLKFLGEPNAQVMPDHEVITADFFKKHLIGKTFLFEGRVEKLTEDDVNFISQVIGDHENIEKEENRNNFITSEKPVERAKAVFFLLDVLTGCFDEKALNERKLVVIEDVVKERFTDLYFRHIDPVRGKIYRPQWGLYAISDIVSTLSTLREKYRFQMESESINIIISEAKKSIEQAFEADTWHKKFNTMLPTLTTQELSELIKEVKAHPHLYNEKLLTSALESGNIQDKLLPAPELTDVQIQEVKDTQESLNSLLQQ